MNISELRTDFPILSTQTFRGQPLCYLDSAASAQKPYYVIDAVRQFYELTNANIHRGVYTLSEQATNLYEKARQSVADFLNAKEAREVVFVRNATEGINLVAASWGRTFLKAGDEIILSMLEHHANIVPWQILAQEKGITIKVIPLLPTGDLDLKAYVKLFTDKTRLVAVTAVSNVLGTVNPVASIVATAHAHGALVLVDACQAVPHYRVDVRSWDADFVVFTGHKLFAPNGIGVLYAKYALLESMPPYQSGGGMIERVSFAGTTFRQPPERFEAGTPAIADAIGLSAAIHYLNKIDAGALEAYENQLLQTGLRLLSEVPHLTVLGNPAHRAPMLSFVMEGIHSHDLATYLETASICVRAGHHCAQPLLHFLKQPATVRVSLAFYNTFEELEHLAKTLHAAARFF